MLFYKYPFLVTTQPPHIIIILHTAPKYSLSNINIYIYVVYSKIIMLWKKNQAKSILILAQIPLENRTPQYLSFKLKTSYSSIVNELQVLEAGGLLKKGKYGKKVYYSPTDQGVKIAKDFMEKYEKEDETKK